MYRPGSGFARLLGFHVAGCSSAAHAAAWPARFNVPDVEERMDLDRGAKQPINLEQVISQPLASSTTSPLRHFVLVSLARPTTVDSRHQPPSLSVLSVILLFVAKFPSFRQLPAWPSTSLCLPPPLTRSTYSIRHPSSDTRITTTAPQAPYLHLRPRCALGSHPIVTTKDGNGAITHLHEEPGCWPTTFHDG